MRVRTLYLASGSPRRLQLLREGGFEPVVLRTGVDDGGLRSGGVAPEEWAGALAYLKAKAGMEHLLGSGMVAGHKFVVLGADTLIVKDGDVIGQARDGVHARSILHRLEGGSHRVVTGVSLLSGADRHVLTDAAEVRLGRLGGERIREYVESGGWRGKAGAYNLSERVEAGWPIEYEGDPTTVMGLPMRLLTGLLEEILGVERFSAQG